MKDLINYIFIKIDKIINARFNIFIIVINIIYLLIDIYFKYIDLGFFYYYYYNITRESYFFITRYRN